MWVWKRRLFQKLLKNDCTNIIFSSDKSSYPAPCGGWFSTDWVNLDPTTHLTSSDLKLITKLFTSTNWDPQQEQFQAQSLILLYFYIGSKKQRKQSKNQI